MSFLHTNITCKFNFLVLCFKNKSRYLNMEDSPPEIAYQLQKIKKKKKRKDSGHLQVFHMTSLL